MESSNNFDNSDSDEIIQQILSNNDLYNEIFLLPQIAVVPDNQTTEINDEANAIKDLPVRKVPLNIFLIGNEQVHILTLSKNAQQYFMPFSSNEQVNEFNLIVAESTGQNIPSLLKHKRYENFVTIAVKELLEIMESYEELDNVFIWSDILIDCYENNVRDEIILGIEHHIKMTYDPTRDLYSINIQSESDLETIKKLQNEWTRTVIKEIIPNATYTLSRKDYLLYVNDDLVPLYEDEITPYADPTQIPAAANEEKSNEKNTLLLTLPWYEDIKFLFIRKQSRICKFLPDVAYDRYVFHMEPYEQAKTLTKSLNYIFFLNKNDKPLFFYEGKEVYILKSDVDANSLMLQRTSFNFAGSIEFGKPVTFTNKNRSQSLSNEQKEQIASLITIFKKEHDFENKSREIKRQRLNPR